MSIKADSWGERSKQMYGIIVEKFWNASTISGMYFTADFQHHLG